MKRQFATLFATLLLCSCQNDPEPITPVPDPGKTITPEQQQTIRELNAGLVSLRDLSGALARSTVREFTPDQSGAQLVFGDGSRATIVCAADAPAPLIGMADDAGVAYWVLAAEPNHPWLLDAAGERMPIAGVLPIAGIDEQGFWTVATDAKSTPWQILSADGKPIAAKGDEPVVQFRSVTLEAGRVKISLAGGGELSLAKLEDLSAAGTANSYIAAAPGQYCFRASVRGNGVGELSTAGLDPKIELVEGMTADWLWSDTEGLVSGVAFDKTTGEISFTLGQGRGNALIALMLDGEVVWSWHIWATDAPQTMAYANGVVFMDRNLGAVGTTVGGVDAYGLYYQWGRKDPFYGGVTTETSAEAFLQAKNKTIFNAQYPDLTWVAASGAFSTVAYAAAHPTTFLYNKIGVSSVYDWLASPRATMWGAVKSLNDPCPAGYKLPAVEAWADLCQGRQYIDGVSAWDGVNFGMTYTFDGKTAWYPAQGSRNQNTGSLIGLGTTRSGNYWSSEAASQTSMFFYFQKKLTTSSGSINTELDKNRSFGYTVRCCKE